MNGVPYGLGFFFCCCMRASNSVSGFWGQSFSLIVRILLRWASFGGRREMTFGTSLFKTPLVWSDARTGLSVLSLYL